MEMTVKKMYSDALLCFKEHFIEDCEIDSVCLIKKHFGLDRQGVILYGDRKADENDIERFQRDVDRRLKGEPLQYILGEWPFHARNFKVGKGVLIPRDDTEVLLLCAERFASNLERPRIMDLCAGSGAICISLACDIEDSDVWGIEYSELATPFFVENAWKLSNGNLTPIKGDIFVEHSGFEDEFFDIIVSNPPYIKSDEIPTLQREVQFEPKMALDGGKDGLDFYRKITQLWTSKLKIGGMLAFELGEGQYEQVYELMKKSGYDDISYELDLQGIKRVIKGIRKYYI